jgi:hypothetical protein
MKDAPHDTHIRCEDSVVEPSQGTSRAHGSRTRRVALAAAAVLVAVNVWTGAPLLALWVGSRFAGSSGLSMAAVGIVVVVLTAAVIVLVRVLTHLSAAYDREIGYRGPRTTAPWLRSMRGEREDLIAEAHGFNAVERVVVLSVGACAIAFNVWFFFFAGSPLAGG